MLKPFNLEHIRLFMNSLLHSPLNLILTRHFSMPCSHDWCCADTFVVSCCYMSTLVCGLLWCPRLFLLCVISFIPFMLCVGGFDERRILMNQNMHASLFFQSARHYFKMLACVITDEHILLLYVSLGP